MFNFAAEKKEAEDAANFTLICKWCQGMDWEKLLTTPNFKVEGGTEKFYGEK
jgi:hypothetical protein